MAGQRDDLKKLARDEGLSTAFLSFYAYKLNLVSVKSIYLIAARKVFSQNLFFPPLLIRVFEEGQ
jgi:hypothetical protein